jgi:hypothetical protein
MASENNFNQASSGSNDARPGPFLATVIGHQDPTFMGTIEVELLRPTGNNSDETALHQVKYMSPFYGVTSASHIGANNDYASTQKSYGFWMVPPDVGTTVVVIFIDGDPRRGFWIGCVQDQGMNFMLPGLAATQKVEEDVEPDKAGRYGRVPVAEYNKKVTGFENPDGTQTWKPKHPLADALDRQGLLFDDARGITTSSARREVPSMVFGISTPGPVDNPKWLISVGFPEDKRASHHGLKAGHHHEFGGEVQSDNVWQRTVQSPLHRYVRVSARQPCGADRNANKTLPQWRSA